MYLNPKQLSKTAETKPPKWAKRLKQAKQPSKYKQISEKVKRNKIKKHDLDLCHVTMAAWSRAQIHLCDIGPVKMDEHKHDEHEDIGKRQIFFFTFWLVF